MSIKVRWSPNCSRERKIGVYLSDGDRADDSTGWNRLELVVLGMPEAVAYNALCKQKFIKILFLLGKLETDSAGQFIPVRRFV